jgi:hypothetical protein
MTRWSLPYRALPASANWPTGGDKHPWSSARGFRSCSWGGMGWWRGWRCPRSAAHHNASVRRHKSAVGLRSPGIARSRPYAARARCERQNRRFRRGSDDPGDLTVPRSEITSGPFPPMCIRKSGGVKSKPRSAPRPTDRRAGDLLADLPSRRMNRLLTTFPISGGYFGQLRPDVMVSHSGRIILVYGRCKNMRVRCESPAPG